METFHLSNFFGSNVNMTIELEQDLQGRFQAHCPELKISTKDSKEEQALLKLKSRIIYCLTTFEEFGISDLFLKQMEQGNLDISKLINTTVH